MSITTLDAPALQQLDEATQQAMMAWHFKQQQKQKELEADDSEYTTSAWADSRTLKQHLSGIPQVKLA